MEEAIARKAPSRNYTKYRWAILVASCLVNLCIGSLYAWSVFAAPMSERLSALSGADVGSLAIVFTVANAVGPVTMISGGAVNDRIGPRLVILAGGILFGAGMIVSGFATNVPMLTVAYGLGCGLGMGMVYGATVSNAVKFFPDKNGLVGGIATASYGFSSVIVPMIANALIARFDVAAAFKIIGVAMLVIVCASSLFIEACPKGFVPDGWTPRRAQGGPAPEGKDWKGMLADPVFFVMIAMLCCGAFSGLMITSQVSPIAQETMGMAAGQAALVVSALALANTVGRIVSGFASDRLGAVRALRIVFALLIAGMALLFFAGSSSVALFFAGVGVIGFCFGSVMGIYPGFTAARFGSRNNSVNYGIMFVGFALAGLLGPSIMNALFAATGSYQLAFAAAAALGALGIAFTFAYDRLRARR